MPSKLDPAALSLEALVQVLQAAGAKHVSVDALEADLEAGAPTNKDGTVNLVHYAAWLVKAMSRGSD